MAYFVISPISENFCQPLIINIVFLIERSPKILVNVLKLLVYSSIKKKISRNLCWQRGAANSCCFNALLEISHRFNMHESNTYSYTYTIPKSSLVPMW